MTLFGHARFFSLHEIFHTCFTSSNAMNPLLTSVNYLDLSFTIRACWSVPNLKFRDQPWFWTLLLCISKSHLATLLVTSDVPNVAHRHKVLAISNSYIQLELSQLCTQTPRIDMYSASCSWTASAKRLEFSSAHCTVQCTYYIHIWLSLHLPVKSAQKS